MIAVANFIGLPLLFFSSILIAASLIPDWMETLSLGNPVEWAVRASRGQALPGTDWGSIGPLPRAARGLHGAHRRLCDPLLPLLPADAVDDRRARRPRPRLPDPPGDRRRPRALPRLDAVRTGSRPTARRRAISARRQASGSCPARRTVTPTRRSPRSATAWARAFPSSGRAAGSSTRLVELGAEPGGHRPCGT